MRGIASGANRPMIRTTCLFSTPDDSSRELVHLPATSTPSESISRVIPDILRELSDRAIKL